MNKENIEKAIPLVKELRREYSRMIEYALDSDDKYECEDMIRLVGHLQATYDHLLASRAHDGDTYCCVAKHLPTALILAGEIGIDVGPIYNIMSVLTDGKIKPCSACKEDKNEK